MRLKINYKLIKLKIMLGLSFNAKVEGADIENINEFLKVSKDIDIDTGTPTVYVDYELEPEARSWGIKSISANIIKVATSIEWEVSCEELTAEDKEALIKAGGTEYRNNTIGGVIEIDTTIDEWEIEQSIEFASDGGFMINDVLINLLDKSIEIN